MNAIREVVNSGQVQAGKIVRLETIPIPFLRDVPLIQGQWLDRSLIELAEWCALLKSQGYQVQEAQEAHQLAVVRFVNRNGEKVAFVEIQALRRKVQLFLKKYSGLTQEIEGLTYLNFEDYCNWRGRKIKGDLRRCVKEGLVTASWNRWVSDHGGESMTAVAGVVVGELQCSVRAFSYYSCPQNIHEQIRQRDQMLENMRCWSFKPDRKENLIQEWKDAVSYCLVELYAFRHAITAIQKTYYNGQLVLFPDVAQDLARLIAEAETTVNNFNDMFADGMGLYQPLEFETLHNNANQQVNRVMAYIVDMAKAEALDCLGDEQAAVKIVERYL